MYFRRQGTRFSNYLESLDHFLVFFIHKADSLRAKFLFLTLKAPLLRTVYTNCALRLGSTFSILSILTLLFAIRHPDLLLILGPLIYGYMHLIASYRFTQPLIKFKKADKVQKGFMLFCLITLIEIIIQGYIKAFQPELLLPNGYLGIIASVILLLYFALRSSSNINGMSILFAIMANLLLLNYAWDEPLNFVSIALFLHNWVAFAFWIYFAKDRSNFKVALGATLFFAVIHIIVMYGLVDSFLASEVESAFFAANVKGTAWILAPWSSDPIVWKRALTLYTFGLSLHYFIWLRAIPENLQKNHSPTSFQITFSRMKKELGRGAVYLLFLITLLGTIVWLCLPTLGSAIYFSFSNIHVWLELTFFLSLVGFTKKRIT